MIARAKRTYDGEWSEGYYELFIDHKGEESHWLHVNYVRYEIDPSTLVFHEMEELKDEIKDLEAENSQLRTVYDAIQKQRNQLKKQNAELLEAMKKIKEVKGQFSVPHGKYRSEMIADKAIQKAEGGEK